MTRFDLILVNPAREELETALRQAVAAVASEPPNPKGGLASPLPDEEGLWLQVEGTAAGFRQWNADGGRSAVALGWWMDQLKRKHHRVLGKVASSERPLPADFLRPLGEPRPPLWFLYPDYVFLKRDGGRRQALVLCVCGAYGTPEQLGWLGTCCDACHDRREEGLTSVPAWLDPGRSTLKGLAGRLLFLACSPDGQLVAGGSGREEISIWETASGQERIRLQAPAGEWLLGVEWLADSQTVLAGSASGKVYRWDALSGKDAGHFATKGAADAFAATPGGALLARSDRHRTSIWTATGHARRDLDSLAGVQCLCFAPNGQLLAAGNRQGTLVVWDVVRGDVKVRLERPGFRVSCLAFSPDSHTVAVGLLPEAAPTDDPDASLDDVASPVLLVDLLGTGFVRTKVSGHEGGTLCVAFAPDGRLLATGGNDGAVRLWDASTGRERVALEWHLGSVCSLAFTPDGQTLATGSFDGTAKLWPREVLRPLERRGEGSLMVR